MSEEESRSVFWDMEVSHKMEEYLSLCLWGYGLEFRGVSFEHYTITNQKAKNFCQESLLEDRIGSS